MEPFLGEIRLVGFNFPPVGWNLCDGSLLQISVYDALFSLLGTTWAETVRPPSASRTSRAGCRSPTARGRA